MITGEDIWNDILPKIKEREGDAYNFKEMYMHGWYDAMELVETLLKDIDIIDNRYIDDGK